MTTTKKAGSGYTNAKRIRFNKKKVLTYSFMLVLVMFTMLPMEYMIVSAFKPMDEIYIFPPKFYVMNPTLRNFSTLFMSLGSLSVPFTRFIFNSLVTSVLSVVFTVVVCSMGAYALSKLKIKHSTLIFNIIIAALMFGTHVTQIPTYIIVKNLGMINTYFSLIIPKIAIAYNFFLIKQFMDQMPNSLLEAARIDGAGEFRIFWQLVMPILKPAWSTVVVFSFVANWNDYFSPLIFINKQVMKTLPLALQLIAERGTAVEQMNIARAGAISAAVLLTTLPTIIIFVIMQKKVIQTMAHSGIKG